MFFKISIEDFNDSPIRYKHAYPVTDGFYIQLFHEDDAQDTWTIITKEEFESNRPTERSTAEQTKIEQLEMDNALILMELAEKDARIAQAEADHATLLMELAVKGVI